MFFRAQLTRIILLCIIIWGTMGGSVVHAFEPHIALQISPAYPRPGETLTASLSSYAVELERADITWYVDGSMISTGVGETALSIPVEKNSGAISIRATITVAGISYERTLSVTPGSIDLLWEAPQTYTPPFYRGKALPASGAFVKVVAVPYILTETSRIATDDLIYTWSRNDFKRDVRNQSGYGKSTLTMKKNLLLPNETIAVEALSQNGAYGASAAIAIPEVEPQIIMYQDHPLYGVQYQTVLETVLEGNSEKSESILLAAEPFFFSLTNNTLSSLTFDWSINGNSIAPNWEKPNRISLGITEGMEGEALTRLSVSAPDFLLQEASRVLSLILNTHTTRDFFYTP
jgi:hypothetical protein